MSLNFSTHLCPCVGERSVRLLNCANCGVCSRRRLSGSPHQLSNGLARGNGRVGNGIPDTTEVAAINPSVTGIGVYTVHIVYFTNTPGLDQPLACASVVSNRQAVYLKGGITFSPNWHNTSPGSGSVTEPSGRTDFLGNHYTAGIHGFPAGCDLW